MEIVAGVGVRVGVPRAVHLFSFMVSLKKKSQHNGRKECIPFETCLEGRLRIILRFRC